MALFTEKEQKEQFILLSKDKNKAASFYSELFENKNASQNKKSLAMPANHAARTALCFFQAAKKNCLILSVDPRRTNNKIVVECIKHRSLPNTKANAKILRYVRSERKLTTFCNLDEQFKCCQYANMRTLIKKELEQKLQKFGHKILGRVPDSTIDSFVVFCTHHKWIIKTNWQQYNSNKYALTCCALELSVQDKPAKPAKRQTPAFRQDKAMFAWRKLVAEKYSECVFTSGSSVINALDCKADCKAETNKIYRPKKVVLHHLYGATAYPALRFEVENGICIDSWLHHQYHKWLGQRNAENVTPYTLICFLKVISTPSILKAEICTTQTRIAELQTQKGRAVRSLEKREKKKLQILLEVQEENLQFVDIEKSILFLEMLDESLKKFLFEYT